MSSLGIAVFIFAVILFLIGILMAILSLFIKNLGSITKWIVVSASVLLLASFALCSMHS